MNFSVVADCARTKAGRASVAPARLAPRKVLRRIGVSCFNREIGSKLRATSGTAAVRARLAAKAGEVALWTVIQGRQHWIGLQRSIRS
jgi:hypothetical protein